MLKKTVLLMTLFISLFALTGCFASEKVFTKAGITITLTDKFYEKEIVSFPLYLESIDNIFMGMREEKSLLASYYINTINEYASGVLNNGGVTADILTYEDENTKFLYAYYSKTVEEQDFGYMLIIMEGENHFYSMNLGCFDKNLEKSKPQFLDWAKTIIVE